MGFFDSTMEMLVKPFITDQEKLSKKLDDQETVRKFLDMIDSVTLKDGKLHALSSELKNSAVKCKLVRMALENVEGILSFAVDEKSGVIDASYNPGNVKSGSALDKVLKILRNKAS